MSRYVDMDKCPCNKCKRMSACGQNVIHPYCNHYEEWLKGEDVVLVKHGHWVHDEHDCCMRCSECKIAAFLDDEFGEAEAAGLTLYCSHCGAKMVEVSE